MGTSSAIGDSAIESVNGWPRYSSSEMARRHDALARMMTERDLLAVVVCGATGINETSVHYFTNWPPLTESYAIFFAAGPPVMFVRLWNHLPDSRLIAVVDDIQYGGDTPYQQAMNVALTLRANGCETASVGFIGPLRYSDMVVLRRELPETTWVDLNVHYSGLRLIKSQEELIYTRVASGFGDTAVAAMEEQIRPGIREYEIAKIIEDTYLAKRGTNLIHFTLSTPMDAPSACVPHQYQPDRVIQQGDVIVTEISANFWGYAGQILRSFTVAAEPTPLYRELYEVAMSVYEGILAILRPGVTVGEILDVAEGVHESGFSIWDDLIHGFSGAYLPPILRTRQTRGSTHPDEFAYEAGTVLVLQPNVISADRTAGVQVGNAIHIAPAGPEVLQSYPMKFIRCG